MVLRFCFLQALRKAGATSEAVTLKPNDSRILALSPSAEPISRTLAPCGRELKAFLRLAVNCFLFSAACSGRFWSCAIVLFR